MRIVLRPARVFEAKDAAGATALLTLVSEWNGMVELRDANGDKLVVTSESSPTARVIGEVFGNVTGGGSEWVVLAGAPRLIERLGLSHA